MVESGILVAKATLPWTFKLFWGPIIDSFTYKPMGKRRPWILFAQLGMALSLIGLVVMGDISNNISLLGWMFFAHNCFASMQDVSCDALAVDVLLPEEQGKVNGAMWASKVIGVGSGAVVMGTLLTKVGLIFSVMFQIGLIFITMALPILFIEKPGDKRFPWSNYTLTKTISNNNFENPMIIIQGLVRSFSTVPTISLGAFILLGSINQGINSGIMPVFYNQTLGWEPDKYSQIIGGPGAILEFIGALLGGYLADRFGKRKIFFIGWGGFSIWCGMYGAILMNYQVIPSWIQVGWLIVGPALIAMGTVSMFSLAMAMSWGTASATMFTSYMAISNLSVVIGTSLIGTLTASLSISQIYLGLTVIGLAPMYILKFADPTPILKIKNTN